MLLLFKPQTLLVDHGRVFCPLRGDIDVERCFECRWLKSAHLSGHEPHITCQALEPSYAGPIQP